MRFGLVLASQHAPGEDLVARWKEHLEQVRLARALGFSSVSGSFAGSSSPFLDSAGSSSPSLGAAAASPPSALFSSSLAPSSDAAERDKPH